MNDKESQHLRQLLDVFDVVALGEGDEVAGTNLLAAMALALADLARPGSGIRTPDWRLIPAGCHVLASGSLASNMVLDEVVTPVGSCQNNLLSQLGRLLEDDKAEEKRKDRNLPRRWTLGDAASASPGENSLLRLMSGDPELEPLVGSDDEEWAEVLGSPPSARLADLVRRPRFFISAASPAMLARLLPGIHDGQALVAIGLNRASDVAKFGELCPALMGGMIPAGPVGESVRGKLLVTDPGGVLPFAAKADDDKTSWLARLIWLVDGNAGPEPPPGEGEGGVVRISNVTSRFEEAVQRILASRLNTRQAQPVTYKVDFAKPQARWMRFLRDMEGSLPGIRGTARCLFASLVFGLRQLVGAAEAPGGFKYYREGIEALARHLIRRMANHRAAILFSSEQARRLHQKRKILTKLEGGPRDERSLYRSWIPADGLRELLAELADEGCVRRCGEEWARVAGATLPDDLIRQLALEVP
jgi:hypothetical protein